MSEVFNSLNSDMHHLSSHASSIFKGKQQQANCNVTLILTVTNQENSYSFPSLGMSSSFFAVSNRNTGRYCQSNDCALWVKIERTQIDFLCKCSSYSNFLLNSDTRFLSIFFFFFDFLMFYNLYNAYWLVQFFFLSLCSVEYEEWTASVKERYHNWWKFQDD